LWVQEVQVQVQVAGQCQVAQVVQFIQKLKQK